MLANDLEGCSFDSDRFLRSVIAVIGSLQSHVSITVASFFRIFQMPQVCYASSSSMLNNRKTYSYFFRTFPPTDSQVQALTDIILYYEWHHISMIFFISFTILPRNMTYALILSNQFNNEFTQPDFL